MLYSFSLKCFAGDAFQQCWPLREGPCDPDLVPLADVASIACTARNLGTNAIVNSRNAQSVFTAGGGNTNGGTYADGEFRFFFSALDTALVGSALTTDRETHTFQFIVTLDDGTIGTLEVAVECLSRPAATLNNAFDLGYIYQMWRILANETNPAVPDKDWIDASLQRGLNATNGILEYHVGDSNVTLLADTRSYAWPSSLMKVLWAARESNFVPAADQEQQRQLANPFLKNPSGVPERYMPWGNTIIVDPPPSAAAVASDPTLVLRGITAPGPFRLNGFYQLLQQHFEIPVFWSIGEWFAGPNGNNPALAKANFEMFQGRAVAAKADYLWRQVL